MVDDKGIYLNLHESFVCESCVLCNIIYMYMFQKTIWFYIVQDCIEVWIFPLGLANVDCPYCSNIRGNVTQE